MKENGKLALISFRLKLAQGKITEIEQIVARDDGQFFGGKSLTTADPIYAKVLEPAERSPREEMINIADSYFKALERMDGTRPVPFADTCNGWKTACRRPIIRGRVVHPAMASTSWHSAASTSSSQAISGLSRAFAAAPGCR